MSGQLAVCESKAGDLSTMTEVQLRAGLDRCFRLTVETVIEAAGYWRELKRRGLFVPDLRHGIKQFLPEISDGSLAAEVVVEFTVDIVKSMRGLPLDEQRRLAEGGTIEVIDPENPRNSEELPIKKLMVQTIRRVIVDGEILTPARQRIDLRTKQRHTVPQLDAEKFKRRFKPKFDSAAGTVTVGQMPVRVADLLSELSAAAGPDRPPADIPEEYDTVRGRLTHDEYRSFQASCKSYGLPEWEMVRKALRAFGMIRPE